MNDLVDRLRASIDSGPNLHGEAADALEHQAARIDQDDRVIAGLNAQLTAEISATNSFAKMLDEKAARIEQMDADIAALTAERDQWRTMYNAHMVHYHPKDAAS